MFHKENPDYNRKQVGFYTLDDLIPADHLLRQIDRVIDFSFIYDLVEDTCSHETGRPSLDPMMYDGHQNPINPMPLWDSFNAPNH